MDDKSLNFNAEKILHTLFTPNVKGYDPDEVDSFLDKVIEDYRSYEKYIQDAQAYIQSLETKLHQVQADCRDKSRDLAKASARVKGIKDDRKVSAANIDLLQYIDRLERALYQKGVDPSQYHY